MTGADIENMATKITADTDNEILFTILIFFNMTLSFLKNELFKTFYNIATILGLAVSDFTLVIIRFLSY